MNGMIGKIPWFTLVTKSKKQGKVVPVTSTRNGSLQPQAPHQVCSMSMVQHLDGNKLRYTWLNMKV